MTNHANIGINLTPSKMGHEVSISRCQQLSGLSQEEHTLQHCQLHDWHVLACFPQDPGQSTNYLCVTFRANICPKEKCVNSVQLLRICGTSPRLGHVVDGLIRNAIHTLDV